MSEIFFRKLYKSPKEGEAANAIIVYVKYDWVAESCDHIETGHRVVIEWKHRLQVDLWLFIVRFEWNTKRPNKCEFKRNQGKHRL